MSQSYLVLYKGPMDLSLPSSQFLASLVLIHDMLQILSTMQFFSPKALDFGNYKFEWGHDKALDDPVVGNAFLLCSYGYTCLAMDQSFNLFETKD